MIDWHRLFGLGMDDLFHGSPWAVELEVDLSRMKQRLDIIVVRRMRDEFVGTLPDGLNDLDDFNLVTYKSLHQPLNDWALIELIGHFVNYRKQVSPSFAELLPREQFRLYAVSTRFPQKLAGQISLMPIQPGVYELQFGTLRIVIIVLNEVPRAPHNAFWHLFSSVPDTVVFGAKHYRRHTEDMSTILNQLFEKYRLEGFDMPYTIEDFRLDVAREQLKNLTPEERMKGLPAEKRLEGLPAEKRLEGLPAEKRLEGLPAEKRLQGLSVEEIEAYLRKIKRSKSPRKPTGQKNSTKRRGKR